MDIMDNMDIQNLPRRRQRSVSPCLKKKEKKEDDMIEKEENEDKNENEKKSKCQKIAEIIHEYFLEHPESVNMTYFTHFKRAMWMAIQTGMATSALVIHSIIPKFFPYTGSSIIKQLHHSITEFENNHKIN